MKPTEKQIKYIKDLAKRLGKDMPKDLTKEEAREIIREWLEEEPEQETTQTSNNNKDIVLGLAIKLVYQRWISKQEYPIRNQEDKATFRDEVEETYRLFQAIKA